MLFIPMSLVHNDLAKNKRLYVKFVDIMKCFDSIYRNGLNIKNAKEWNPRQNA